MITAIVTKFISPSNLRGARISVKSGGGHRIIVHWDDSLNAQENHRQAARKLADKMRWEWPLLSGGGPNGTCFHVFDHEMSRPPKS